VREFDDDMSTDDSGGRLEVLTYAQAVQRITASLVERSNEVIGPMKILEAGCGRRWEIDLGARDYQITGIDLDVDALDHRRIAIGDLDVAVVGTICDPDIVQPRHFDVVYSAYVLEHIESPGVVLTNFVTWARPGGLIVMMLPNRNSVYGWVARHTPYRLHVWVYRYLFHNPGAGKPGFGPYPTHHDPALAPNSLADFCRANGLLQKEWFAIDTFSQKGAKFAAIRLGMRLVSLLSGRRVSDREVDLVVVWRTPPAQGRSSEKDP
jgi:SAM-dependent methyltransferase